MLRCSSQPAKTRGSVSSSLEEGTRAAGDMWLLPALPGTCPVALAPPSPRALQQKAETGR